MLLIAAAAVLLALTSGAGSRTPADPGQPLRPVTATSGCRYRGHLPDPHCTPGALLSSERKRICRVGYTRTVRHVDSAMRRRIYSAYGVGRHPRGAYEIDHLVPLELGGGNDASNLWPQPASPAPGFHEKDGLENYLHDRVCAGVEGLSAAQTAIARDWYARWVAAGRPR